MNEKPNRLQGIIAPKGEAVRPLTDTTARTPAVEPEISEPVETPRRRSGRAAPASLGSTSLTLRLPARDYEKLRLFAFKARRTHQDVLESALAEYLERHS